MVVALQFLVPVLYLLAMAAYARVFSAENESRVQWLAVGLLVVSLAAHTALLFAISRQYDRCPVMTIGEGILFCSWILGVIHLVSESVTKTRSLGVFTLFPTTVGVVIAAVILEDSPIREDLRNSYFIFHIIGAVAAYVCFGFVMVMACMYLALHRRLKQKTFDHAFRKLPSLEKLDGLCAAWSVMGSVAMIATYAAMWKWDHMQEVSSLSLTQIAAVYLSLAVFIIAGIARKLVGFTGPRYIKTVLFGFGVFVVCVMWVHGTTAG